VTRSVRPMKDWLLAIGVLLASVCAGAIPALPREVESPLAPMALDPRLAAMVPPAIRTKGFITFATVGTSPPGAFIAADGRTVIGFEIDLLRAIGQVLGLKVSFERVQFDALIPGILGGRYEGANSTFDVFAARVRVVDMITYGQAGVVMIVPKGNSIDFSSYELLCGHSVATVLGSADVQILTEQNAVCSKLGRPPIDIKVFPDQDMAALATASHRTDVFATNTLSAGYRISRSSGALTTSTPFNRLPVGFAVGKTTGLTPALLQATAVVMRSPLYHQIFTKWGIAAGETGRPELNMTKLTVP
jgi:polar amino acid transport system substrate-binding protein